MTEATVSANRPARYIMIAGFLGAGKTTAVLQLARWLTERGLRVGLITNDQGSRLVDTNILSVGGFPVEEIPGGCFCCRFNSLVEAAKRLTETTRPDIFITEPVGSCTDLVATVTYPLRKLYGTQFSIAPLSVLVDPIRALRVFGLERGARFSDKVVYIYRKQLEEADAIVVNKRDLLTDEQAVSLTKSLESQFPAARVFEVSARKRTGLEQWFKHITEATQVPRALVEVDYAAYAEGEARLGWLNCTVRLESQTGIDGNQLVQKLAREIQKKLSATDAEVAHLKMTLDANTGLGDLAVVNLVRNDFVPELSQTLQDDFQCGELTINMRAEAAPEELQLAVQAAIAFCTPSGLSVAWEHLEAFRPGKPEPTHRMALPL
jgi:G3E family GTPase